MENWREARDMTTRRNTRPQDLEALPTPTPRADRPTKSIKKEVKKEVKKEQTPIAAETNATGTVRGHGSSTPSSSPRIPTPMSVDRPRRGGKAPTNNFSLAVKAGEATKYTINVVNGVAASGVLRGYLEGNGIEADWRLKFTDAKIAAVQNIAFIARTTTFSNDSTVKSALGVVVYTQPKENAHCIKWVHSRRHAGRGDGLQRRLDDYLFAMPNIKTHTVDSPAYAHARALSRRRRSLGACALSARALSLGACTLSVCALLRVCVLCAGAAHSSWSSRA